MKLKFLLIFFLVLSPVFSYGDVAKAEKNYRQIFNVGDGSVFNESPFEGWYLLKSAKGSYTVFDEDVNHIGLSNSWEVKGANGRYTALSMSDVQLLKKKLLISIKPDWLIRTDYGSSQNKAILIVAPNCPACKMVEESLKKFGNQLNTKIYLMPSLLGQGSDKFRNAIICASDPTQAWYEAIKKRPYPAKESSCLKSDWISLVWGLALRPNNTATVPTIIKPDGDIMFGWVKEEGIDAVRWAVGEIK